MELEGFKPFDFSVGIPSATITANGITFNKDVVRQMGFASHVFFLIDRKNKRIAIQQCESDAPNAKQFFKKETTLIFVRWASKRLLKELGALMDADLEMHGYRVCGTLLRDEKAMVFDLKTAKELV
jgi:hypothetical protein